MFVDRRGSPDVHARGNRLVICCEGNAAYYELGLLEVPAKGWEKGNAIDLCSLGTQAFTAYACINWYLSTYTQSVYACMSGEDLDSEPKHKHTHTHAHPHCHTHTYTCTCTHTYTCTHNITSGVLSAGLEPSWIWRLYSEKLLYILL